MPGIYEALASAFNRAAELTIIEIGAHDGSATCKLRALFPAARLYSFESDPRNIAAIRTRGFDRLTRLVESAVGDRDGTAQLDLSEPDAQHPVRRTRVRSERWTGSGRGARVPITRLDTFTQREGLAAVDVVWADLHGAEDLIVAGAQRTLASTRLFYTRYDERAMYARHINLETLLGRLPGGTGAWRIAGRRPNDVLFENVATAPPAVIPVGAHRAGAPAR